MSNRSAHHWPSNWQYNPDKQATVTQVISSVGWHARVALRAKCADFPPCSPVDCCRSQQPRLARPHPHAASAPAHMLLPCQHPLTKLESTASALA